MVLMLGPWICTDGHLERWDVRLMVHLILESAQESIEKKYGTMGGPGNRTQVPTLAKHLANRYTTHAHLLI